MRTLHSKGTHNNPLNKNPRTYIQAPLRANCLCCYIERSRKTSKLTKIKTLKPADMIKDLKRGQAHTSESTHGLFSCHDAPLKPGGAISVYVRKRNKHSVCVCVLCVCLSCPFLLHTTSVSKLDVFTPSTTSKPPVSLKMRRPLFFFFCFVSLCFSQVIDRRTKRSSLNQVSV